MNQWIRPKRPLTIAHRGHSTEMPENTLLAYRRAIELGVDMIECDVNMTKDGELVMIHDWSLDRTTNATGLVRDFTLDEIRELDAGVAFGEEFAGLRVPTTIETIELAREAGILMCFEVKGESPRHHQRTAMALVDLLISRDTLGWAWMSGYDHAALAAAKARAPELMLAPERLPDDIPPPPGEALRQANALGSPAIQNHWAYVTDELVASLHDNDVALWLWPTTTDSEVQGGIDAGVDGLMGDDVDALVRAVTNVDQGASSV